MRRIPTFLFGGLLLLIAACSSQVPDLEASTTEAPDQSVDTADSSTTLAVTSTTELLVFVPEALRGLDTAPISIVDGEITYVLTVAVADSGESRGQGLMNIADLGDLDGMLFVWDSPTTTSFWMKDTIIPLSAAFAEESGRIVRILDMRPDPRDGRDVPQYKSGEPATYVLEMEQGWFERNGIRAGDQMVLHPQIQALTPR